MNPVERITTMIAGKNEYDEQGCRRSNDEIQALNEVDELRDLVKRRDDEIRNLKSIIRNGGLPAECITGFRGEIKFCEIRNGHGGGCLKCFD